MEIDVVAANLMTTFYVIHDQGHSLSIKYSPNLQQSRVIVSKELELLRAKLRSVDEAIIVLLAERMTISRTIGSHKKELKLKIKQPDQWEKASEARSLLANEYHVDDKLVKDLFERIHKESIKKQK